MRLQDDKILTGALKSALFTDTGITEVYCTLPHRSFGDATVYLSGYLDQPNTRTLAKLLTTAFQDIAFPVRKVYVMDCVAFPKTAIPSYAYKLESDDLSCEHGIAK